MCAWQCKGKAAQCGYRRDGGQRDPAPECIRPEAAQQRTGNEAAVEPEPIDTRRARPLEGEGLGIAFLSRYAVAEEVDAGSLEAFRLAGRAPLRRNFFVARPARRALAPSEREFVATLTRCCAKTATYAEACVGVVPG